MPRLVYTPTPTRIDSLRAARTACVVIAAVVVLALVTALMGMELPCEILLTVEAVYLLVRIMNLSGDIHSERLVIHVKRHLKRT